MIVRGAEPLLSRGAVFRGLGVERGLGGALEVGLADLASVGPRDAGVDAAQGGIGAQQREPRVEEDGPDLRRRGCLQRSSSSASGPSNV